MRFTNLFRNLGLGVLLVVLIFPVSAADSKGADEWQFEGNVYLWGAAIDATPDGGETIHLSFSDLIDNLDMAFMGGLGARKGKWSLLADVIYLNASVDQKGSARLVGQDIRTKVNVEMENWIITLAGGYRVVENDDFTLDLLAGGRYLWIELPLEFDLGPINRKVTPSGDVWDGIVGARGEVELSDKWYLSYYADVGTGQSDLTKQALLGLNYRFDKVVASVGYRYLDFDLKDDLDDLTIKGPYAGVRFRF